MHPNLPDLDDFRIHGFIYGTFVLVNSSASIPPMIYTGPGNQRHSWYGNVNRHDSHALVLVDLWGNDPQARHCKCPSRPIR